MLPKTGDRIYFQFFSLHDCTVKNHIQLTKFCFNKKTRIKFLASFKVKDKNTRKQISCGSDVSLFVVIVNRCNEKSALHAAGMLNLPVVSRIIVSKDFSKHFEMLVVTKVTF